MSIKATQTIPDCWKTHFQKLKEDSRLVAPDSRKAMESFNSIIHIIMFIAASFFVLGGLAFLSIQSGALHSALTHKLPGYRIGLLSGRVAVGALIVIGGGVLIALGFKFRNETRSERARIMNDKGGSYLEDTKEKDRQYLKNLKDQKGLESSYALLRASSSQDDEIIELD